jgi:hypothetical protein
MPPNGARSRRPFEGMREMDASSRRLNARFEVLEAERGASCVVHLVRVVDGEQAGVLAGDAHHEGAGRRRHLVVRVRQAAGERLDAHGVVQFRNRLEHRVERHVPIL